MSGPNIEMIAASLKKCSLQGGGGRSDVLSPPEVGSPPEEEEEEVTVELNSEVALPYKWEQCLDMKTGKVYFINWSDGTRTTEDPRLSGYYSEEVDCYSESSDSDSYDSSSNDNAIHNHNNYFGTDDNCSTTASSSSSSSAYSPGEPPVLVAAGCRSCFMYFMVLKLDFTCPKCGGNLIHLGRSGCSS